MQNLVSRLENLELKLNKVIKNLEKLKLDKNALEQENAEIRKELKQAKDKLAEFGENDVGSSLKQNKKMISSKIDEYIAEIDACIDLINQESGEKK